jgi:hypothetical protein
MLSVTAGGAADMASNVIVARCEEPLVSVAVMVTVYCPALE